MTHYSAFQHIELDELILCHAPLESCLFINAFLNYEVLASLRGIKNFEIIIKYWFFVDTSDLWSKFIKLATGKVTLIFQCYASNEYFESVAPMRVHRVDIGDRFTYNIANIETVATKWFELEQLHVTHANSEMFVQVADWNDISKRINAKMLTIYYVHYISDHVIEHRMSHIQIVQQNCTQHDFFKLLL